MKFCGVILAGGQSRRMGTNKALLPLNGKQAIGHILDEVSTVVESSVIISNEIESYSFLQIPVYQDIHPGKGPLAGLESVMENVESEWYVIIACDMPLISRKIIGELIDEADLCDAVVPKVEGRKHPLMGVYHRSVLSIVKECIKNNELRMESLLQKISVKYKTSFQVEDSVVQKHFFNMNHPEEYENAKRMITKN
ncbi:molybdenum cofactor guanylyltransferase [Bacillaceae bacterium S4-13-58]